MPPGRGASQRWLRAAFGMDSAAGPARTGLPPAFLCPAVQTAAGRAAPMLTTARLGRLPWPHPSAQRRHVSGASAAAVGAGAGAAAGVGVLLRRADADSEASAATATTATTATAATAATAAHPKRRLPLQCPGCGAFAQTVHADQPGFFDLGRRSTAEYLGLAPEKKPREREEDRVVEAALRRLEHESGSQEVHLGSLLRPQGGGADAKKKDDDTPPSILCVRCHDLVHHAAGTPIVHPGIDAIRETLAESPYKYNHVYHVLDAADFPMSLLPRIHDLLDTMPLRSRNRRSRHGKFYGGRLTELSFVVARSDLFAPRKNQVDRLMPWIRETLRDALGRLGRHVRLGNVRCVSARRSWWTADLREEIWKRGGANWLVGKANVGKSNLVHHVFPKGRMDSSLRGGAEAKKKPLPSLALQQSASGSYGLDPRGGGGGDDDYDAAMDAAREADLDETALLPPRPPETNYPPMPVVSALPGTTASPIRIPFGSGKGELIDLPGLARTALADVVQARYHDALVMKTRVQPEQVALKGPWQSLLLGGFIRITPRTPDLVFLTYNFTPLPEHRTMTDKAVAIQAQTSELRVENMAVPGTGETIRLAGSFQLQYDVTKQRAGPITRKDAANIRVDRLPYRVVALDLLIEGCGWVEVVAQVRTRHLFNEEPRRRVRKDTSSSSSSSSTPEILQTLDLSEPPDDEYQEHGDADADADAGINWPVIDVYSPGGKFIGARRPLNAWLMAQPKASQRRKSLRARPKKSMKGAKKLEKAKRRASEA